VAPPFVVWIVVGLVTVVALLAVLIGLLRHALVLMRTLGRFQREVTPIAEALSAEADRASRRAARLSDERSFGRS
jgi:hypothetical protein